MQKTKEQYFHLLTHHWLYSGEGGDPQLEDTPSLMGVDKEVEHPDTSSGSAGDNEAGATHLVVIATELNLNLQSNHQIPYAQCN